MAIHWKEGRWRVRLVLCDDNRILCEALASILQARGHLVLAIATSASDSITAVATSRPDACLLEVRFPDGDGLDVARAIRRRHPETKIVVLTCVTDPAVVSEAKKIGVTGFLRKDQTPETLTSALEAIGSGKVAFGLGPPYRPSGRSMPSPRKDIPQKLTPRERQVLQRIVAGQSTGQMAREMNVATSTLYSHIGRMMTKLGAHSRVQAAAIASRWPVVRDFET
jgi:two-component system, NarL family, nitrate/nitrite response regulator NarL